MLVVFLGVEVPVPKQTTVEGLPRKGEDKIGDGDGTGTVSNPTPEQWK